MSLEIIFPDLSALTSCLDAVIRRNGMAVLAIDGMCGAGKSTLAAQLRQLYNKNSMGCNCEVVHMDDFFLPFALRSPARLAEPGGNIHYERFLEELALPLMARRTAMQRLTNYEKASSDRDLMAHKTAVQSPLLEQTGPTSTATTTTTTTTTTAQTAIAAPPGSALSAQNNKSELNAPILYRKFDCSTGEYRKQLLELPPAPLIILEGSYSLHPKFRALPDVRVFLSCSSETQRSRIIARSGKERWPAFEQRWIPLENAYFSALRIRECADFLLQTDREKNTTPIRTTNGYDSPAANHHHK